MKKLLIVVVCSFIVGGYFYNKTTLDKDLNMKIAIITDTHLMDKSLTDNMETFRDLVDGADGKMVYESEDLLQTFVDNLSDEKYVIFSGDLTWLGSEKSHLTMASFLKKIEDKGIEVLVIPGNHDINSKTSIEVFDEVNKVNNINYDYFKDIYSNYGYNQAVTQDDVSFSYMYDIGSYYVLMLDTNIYDNYVSSGGYIKDETVIWVEDCLKRANKENKPVISITHENLLVHNNMFKNFTIINSEKLTDLYEKYNVQINFSGHMHIQSITYDNGLYDVANSSFAVLDNKYGELTLVDGVSEYKTISLDNGESHQYFFDTSYNKTIKQLESKDISDEDKILLTQFLTEINVDYFSGSLKQKDNYLNNEGYKIMEKYLSDDFMFTYIKSIIALDEFDYNSLSLELK